MKKITIILAGIIIIVLAVYCYRQSNNNLSQNNNIAQTSTPSEATKSVSNTVTEVSSAITRTPEKVVAFLDLLSPKGDESLCKGDDFDISWKGSKEFSTIDVYLMMGSKNNSTTYPLGSFPASYNETGEKNGEGSFSWKVGYTKSGIELQPDETYRIILNGCYPYQDGSGCLMTLNKDPRPFNILDCRG